MVLLRSCLKRDNNWRVIDGIFERHFNQNANGHLGLFRVAIFICQGLQQSPDLARFTPSIQYRNINKTNELLLPSR